MKRDPSDDEKEAKMKKGSSRLVVLVDSNLSASHPENGMSSPPLAKYPKYESDDEKKEGKEEIPPTPSHRRDGVLASRTLFYIIRKGNHSLANKNKSLHSSNNAGFNCHVSASARRVRVKSRAPSSSTSGSADSINKHHRFQIEGYDGDERYIMVEDELLIAARMFTKHIHQQEYQQSRRETKAKGDHADTLARATDGITPMTKELGMRKTAEALSDRQQAGLEQVYGRRPARQHPAPQPTDSSDSDDDGDNGDALKEHALAGMPLATRIATAGRNGMPALVGSRGIKSSTRAAKGCTRSTDGLGLPVGGPSSRGSDAEEVQQRQRQRADEIDDGGTTDAGSAEEEEEEEEVDDDDLDAAPAPRTYSSTGRRPARQEQQPPPPVSLNHTIARHAMQGQKGLPPLARDQPGVQKPFFWFRKDIFDDDFDSDNDSDDSAAVLFTGRNTKTSDSDPPRGGRKDADRNNLKPQKSTIDEIPTFLL